jgi:hypothetical protein
MPETAKSSGKQRVSLQSTSRSKQVNSAPQRRISRLTNSSAKRAEVGRLFILGFVR